MRISLDYYRMLGLTGRATPEQIERSHHDRVLSMPRKEYSEAAIASRRRLLDCAHTVLSDPHQRLLHDQAASRSGVGSASIKASPDSTNPSTGEAIAEAAKDINTDINSAGSSREVSLPNTSKLSTKSTPASSPVNFGSVANLEVDDREITGVLLILQEIGDYPQILSLSKAFMEMNGISPRLDWANRDPDVILATAIAHAEVGRDYWKQGQYEAAAQSLESASSLLMQVGLFLSLRNEVQADLFKLCPYRILELLANPATNLTERQRGLTLLQEMLEARRGIDGEGDDYSGLNINDFIHFIQQLRLYMTVAEQQLLFEAEAKRPSTVATYLAVYALIAGGFSQRQPAMIRRAKGLLVKLSSHQDVYLEKAVCALLLGQTEEATKALAQSTEQAQINLIRQASEGAPELLSGLCIYSRRWLQEEVYPHFRDLANQTASLNDYFDDQEVMTYLEALPNMGIAYGAEPTSEWNVGAKSPESWRSLSDRPAVDAFNSATPKPEPRLEVGSTRSAERPLPETPKRTTPDLTPLPQFSNSRRSPKASPITPPPSPEPKPEAQAGENPMTPPKNSTRGKRKLQLGRLLLLLLILGGGLSGLGALLVWGWRSLTQPVTSNVRLVVARPLIAPLVLDAAPASAVRNIPIETGEITQARATKIIEAWQVAKSKALGKEYDSAILDTILTEPALSDWRSRAKDLKSSSSYLEYISKSIEVKSFKADGNDRAVVRTKIGEARNYYEKGNLSAAGSKPDANYEVSYTLVRKDGKWLIQEMLVHN